MSLKIGWAIPGGEQLAPVEHLPGRLVVQTDNRPPERRLARPTLTNQSHALAFGNRQRDAIDRVDRAPGPESKVFRQTANVEKDRRTAHDAPLR